MATFTDEFIAYCNGPLGVRNLPGVDEQTYRMAEEMFNRPNPIFEDIPLVEKEGD